MRARRKRRGRRALVVLLLLLGLAVADSNYRLVTTTYVLGGPTLPEAFDGFRVLQLSDVHGAVYGADNSRLLAAARAAAPDLIALTGDLADKDTDMAELETLLTGLTAIAPVYYVSGNHEWADRRLSELIPLLEGLGVRYLRNESLTLEREGQSIVLIGVEDPFGPADMPKPDAVAAAAPEGFRLLLGHRNDLTEKYPDLAVDVALTGHAHGGVWRIPGLGGLFDHGRKLFPGSGTEGVVTSGRLHMVVSRGIGNTPPLLRLGNNPELVVVELRK